MIYSSKAARERRTRALATAALVLVYSVLISKGAHGQTGRGDTTRAARRGASSQTDSTRADSTRRLERVLISAVRASGAAPISQKTLTSAELKPRSFGQDVPMLLQGAAPSLTSYAETGTYWGYSYMRLRGIDQSRINLTIDGIPLNDPEDQVLYFADFPDLSNSLQSVQVQRGVGTSTNGTASFAGSINMETTSPTSKRGADLQIEGGSFGSRRASAEYTTGLLPGRFAAYARVSALHTDGYRYHSGVEGKSLFLSGGYFGDRDILKATVTTGVMRDTMAYYAVSEEDLKMDRKINPLTPEERDGFGERIAALSYTRLLGPSTSWSTTAYRISASGDYDVLIDELDNFNLKFVWYGVTSAWNFRRDGLQVDIGANGNTYARDHASYHRTDFDTPIYFNTGHKQDASAFAKVAYTVGRATLFGDAQARHAEFRYSPDKNAGITEREISWSFVNPKAGITYALSGPVSLFASYGMTSREPTRNDMLAGADNIDASNVAAVGDLSRVKPERVRDLEVGATFRGQRVEGSVNVYSMDFRNEIAPIGALSLTGSALRENVGASYRRGIEAEANYRPISRVLLTANVATSMNRIREYTDESGDTPVTYRDVEPLLTPRFITYQRAQVDATKNFTVALETRYTSRSYLTNTGDSRFVLPDAFNLDGSVAFHIRDYQVIVRGNNLLDAKKYGSGYESDGVSYYFIVPPRNVFVGLQLGF